MTAEAGPAGQRRTKGKFLDKKYIDFKLTFLTLIIILNMGDSILLRPLLWMMMVKKYCDGWIGMGNDGYYSRNNDNDM